MQREKTFFERELKLVERQVQLDLKSKDLSNQISSETYRRIFEKRMGIYESLLELKNDYMRFDRESHVPEVEDPTDGYYDIYSRIRSVIETNKLYISNELADAYEHWYSKASPLFREANVEGYHTYENSCGDNQLNREIEADLAQSHKLSQMITATKGEMESLLSQIDSDVADIRLKIENLTRI